MNFTMELQHKINQMECRACLTELDRNSTFCNVFSLCDDLPWKDKTYSQLITSCTNTQIYDGDPFPKFICDVCIMDLYTAYNFKLQCELSYKNLLRNKPLYKNKQVGGKQIDETTVESENEIREGNNYENTPFKSESNAKVEYVQELNKRRLKMFKKIDGTLLKYKEPVNKENKGKESKRRNKVSDNKLDNYHIKNGKFICNVCDRVCHNKRYVQYHLMLHDKSRTQYKCSYPNCDRVFLSSGGNGKHLLTHWGKKNFMCEQCGKVFYINADLQAHVNLTHLKIKNFKCDYCPKRYGSNFKRIEHMNTHVNKRPFKCDVCEKRFFKLSALNYHFRVHDKKKK